MVLVCIMAARYGEMGEWLKPHPLLRMHTGNCIEGSNPLSPPTNTYVALIAQLDRALGYELRGREFESLSVYTPMLNNWAVDRLL